MRRDTYVLGLNCSNHDRAACLLKNGEVAFAIAEERIDRRKKSEGFYGRNPQNLVLPPMASVKYVLDAEGISLEDIDKIVCGRSITSCRETVERYLPVDPKKVVEPDMPSHHLAHAYSVFGTMPFEESIIVILDEQGHHTSCGTFEKCTYFHASSRGLELKEQYFGTAENISLGMFYDLFASLIGLGEAGFPSAGKLMGLSAYGAPQEWPNLIQCQSDGNFQILLSEIDDFLRGIDFPMRSTTDSPVIETMEDFLIKYQPISWDTELAKNLAYYAQSQLEQALLTLVDSIQLKLGVKNICLAGGVALNCLANSKIASLKNCEGVFVHPAATDDGTAVGLAYYGWFQFFSGQRKVPKKRFSALTGREYTDHDYVCALESYNIAKYASNRVKLHELSKDIEAGNIVCVFQGRSEWGPRALGNRSILASPILPNSKANLNSKIKYREPYRPLALSGTYQGLSDLLDLNATSSLGLGPYMLDVASAKDDRLSAFEHVDKTIRYQVVDEQFQSEYYQLILSFGQLTGCYAVINTSFNTLGEPLVESPRDAIKSFLVSNADILYLGGYVIKAKDFEESVLNQLRKKAYQELKLDLLQLAVSLDKSGYSEKAREVLQYADISENTAYRRGPAGLSAYFLLKQKFAYMDQDFQAVSHYARKIFQLSSLPFDSLLAVNMLKNTSTGLNQNGGIDQLYQLIANLTHPGQVNRLLFSQYLN